MTDESRETPAKAPEQNLQDRGSQASPAVEFQQLAAGAREVLISHQGQIYRLRETRNGKLILNK